MKKMKVENEDEKEEKTVGYEYLDHTADVQLHSWAPTIEEAFEQVVVAMYGYITDLNEIEFDEEMCVEIEATGHDMDSLLYGFMDEFLFDFNTELNVCKKIKITEFDRDNFKITAKGYGETYDREKHTPGTEIKAITYSAMQILEKEGRTDVYTIVDI